MKKTHFLSSTILGFGVTFVLAGCLATYNDALVEAGFEPATKEKLGKFHVYVAESRKEAHAAEPYLANYGKASAARSQAGHNPAVRTRNLDEEIERGEIIAGDPEDCIRTIKYWRDTWGFTTITGTFYFGGMPQEMALRNIRLFAQEVMPALQESNA